MDDQPPRAAPPGRRHALELLLAPTDETRVRGRWDLLERAGLASSARHRGPTHRPHATVASGPAPDGQLLALAADLWRPLLPVDLPVGGLVLLGGRRPALAELLVPPTRVRSAQEAVAGAWAGADGRPWVAHVTLAPRLPAEEVGAALVALDAVDGQPGPYARRAVGLRWWDPDSGTVHHVCGQES